MKPNRLRQTIVEATADFSKKEGIKMLMARLSKAIDGIESSGDMIRRAQVEHDKLNGSGSFEKAVDLNMASFKEKIHGLIDDLILAQQSVSIGEADEMTGRFETEVD